ncbi:hypothetical protein LJC55_01560 [Eubacteriales bacterium OttesenSCG-928-N14]|nr:hypothetical protein [Eubacteriales bacterium OttesenSCG-928-N14]
MARRNRVFRKRRSFAQLRGSKVWQTIKLLAVLALTVMVVVLFVNYGWPFVKDIMGWTTEEPPLVQPTPTQIGDMTGRIRELTLGAPHRRISYPVIIGDSIYFPTGVNSAGNPSHKQIYVNKMGVTGNIQVRGPQGIYDNIFTMDVNANNIVYFDCRSEAPNGGAIFMVERNPQLFETDPQTAEGAETIANNSPPVPIKLKDIAYGSDLKVQFVGEEYITFVERTGSRQDKLYLMNVNTHELTVLCVYEDSPLGLSQPGVGGNAVVWAAPDPNRPTNDRYAVIHSIQVGGDGTISTYNPEMYVFNPVTNGRVTAWTDSNMGPNATLFMSVEGAAPKRLAEGVANYGMGENFVAWAEDGKVYVHYWDRNITAQVSTEDEYAFLVSFSPNAIGWFDITNSSYDRTRYKYALLD